jgi:hypothetical protein
MDGSLATQQNIRQLALAIVILRAPTNRLEDTSPLMPQVIGILPTLKPGQVVIIGP